MSPLMWCFAQGARTANNLYSGQKNVILVFGGSECAVSGGCARNTSNFLTKRMVHGNAMARSKEKVVLAVDEPAYPHRERKQGGAAKNAGDDAAEYVPRILETDETCGLSGITGQSNAAVL